MVNESDKIPGIYIIRNIQNGLLYIGSSKNIFDRICGAKGHINLLNKNKHINNHLQRAWNKYGGYNFTFDVIEYVLVTSNIRKDLIEIEQKYLNLLLFADIDDDRFSKLGYNICRNAGNTLGYKHTDESKKLIKDKLKGKPSNMSDETRKKIGEIGRSLRGDKSPNFGKAMSDETKRKISESTKGEKSANYGKKKSEDTRKKISETRKSRNIESYWKGKNLTDDTRRKISESKIGKSHTVTEETKNKIRDTHLINKKNSGPKVYLEKSIIQMDKKTGDFIERWDSAKKAGVFLKKTPNHITSCCKGVIKSAYGYLWKYENKK